MTSAAPYLPSLTTIACRPELHDLARARDELALAREELDLGVVEDHAVDLRDRRDERVAGDVDPEVHRVQRDELRPPHCRRTLSCSAGRMFARNSTSASLRGLRELGIEGLEDVEVRLERVARIHVVAVDAAPEERLATLDVLDVVGVDAARVQDRVLVVAEVVADGPHDADLVEERRGQREVHGGAAEHALASAVRRLHGIEGDGSNDSDTHRLALFHSSIGLRELVLRRAKYGGPEAGLARSRRRVSPSVAYRGGVGCARSRCPSTADPRCSRSSSCRYPQPAEGEVLIRVSRAGLNFADTHRRTNTYIAKDVLPLVPGAEVAGVREDGRAARRRAVRLGRVRRVRDRPRRADVPDPRRRRATRRRSRSCCRASRHGICTGQRAA